MWHRAQCVISGLLKGDSGKLATNGIQGEKISLAQTQDLVHPTDLNGECGIIQAGEKDLAPNAP